MDPTSELAAFAELPETVQRAFLRRTAEPRKFAAGTLLYKFTGAGIDATQTQVSSWWSGVLPLGPGDPGLELSLDRAARLGIAPQDFARARSAVVRQWNSMDSLLIIRLVRPVGGYVGRCASQPIDESPCMRNIVWIGGAWQAYLPGLRRGDLVVV